MRCTKAFMVFLLLLGSYQTITAQAILPDSVFKALSRKLMLSRNPEEKIIIHQEILKLYPENAEEKKGKFKPSPTMYEDFYYQIAYSYAFEGKIEKMESYMKKVQDTPLVVRSYAPLAEILYEAKNYKAAEHLLNYYLEKYPDLEKQPKYTYKVGLINFLYVKNLNELGKKEQAIAFAKKNYNPEKENTEQDIYLADMLADQHHYAEAIPIYTKYIRLGQSSDETRNKLKNAYEKADGNTAAYTSLMTTIDQELLAKTKAKVLATLIHTPAPALSFKDVNGKTVHLSDYQGKIVILDFWATWCAPCKASMPGMQIAVNKYKADKDVQFLFIDTGETLPNYVQIVKDFIAQNKFTFTVLFDPKDPVIKKWPAATMLDIKSVPLKFVIDKNGNIRFRVSGSEAGNDALVAEMTAMIEIVKANQ